MVAVEALLAIIDKANFLNILLLSPFPSKKVSLLSYFFRGFEM